MSPKPLAERIERYVARPDSDSFDELAMAAFSELYERDAAFRERCDRVAAKPGRVSGWRSIPLVEAAAPPDGEAARPGSSQRAAAERAFRDGCLAGLHAPPILQLGPGDEAAALRDRFGGDGSAEAAGSGGVDVGAARSWLAARQRDRRAAVIVASPGALERLIGALERQDLRFQLAFGSKVVGLHEIGGGDLGRRCSERLGLATDGFRRQLRWPGVPTPLFGAPASDGGLEGAVPAPWLRVRALDAATLDESREGETGVLSVLDLTIRGRPFHLLTPTHGSVEAGAVRVIAAAPET